MSSDAVEFDLHPEEEGRISTKNKKDIESIILMMLGRDNLIELLKDVRKEFSIPTADVIISYLYREDWDFPGVFVFLPGYAAPVAEFIYKQQRIEGLINALAIARGVAIRQKTFYVREPIAEVDFPLTSLKVSTLVERSPIFGEEWFWFFHEYLLPEVRDQVAQPTFIEKLRLIEGDLIDPVYRRCSTDCLVDTLPSFVLTFKEADYLTFQLRNQSGALCRTLHLWAQSALMPQETNRGC